MFDCVREVCSAKRRGIERGDGRRKGTKKARSERTFKLNRQIGLKSEY